MQKLSLIFPALVLPLLVLMSGCESYHTPGTRADLQQFTPPSMRDAFALEPSYPYPASIAVVRVQGTAYSNHYLSQHGGSFGGGRFTVVLANELGEELHLQSIGELPHIKGIVRLNRLVLPNRIESDRDIRDSAARLKADLVLLYTFDTVFFDAHKGKALSVITLGLSPNRKIYATTTATAMLIDTRTGYIYSAYEATERNHAHSTSWGTRETADQVRRDTETKAFAQLIKNMVEDWPRFLERYPPGSKPSLPPVTEPQSRPI